MSTTNPDNVRIVRLVSGEEIIGKVNEVFSGERRTHLILKDILVMFAGSERGTIGIMPYLPYADLKDGLKIAEENVVFAVVPQDKLLEQYTQAFSKVVTPPKKGLVLAT